MSKKKQTKKRKKTMTPSAAKPSFEVRQSVPKVFGSMGNTGGGNTSGVIRSPGSQRKR